jgi:hypothetical protein
MKVYMIWQTLYGEDFAQSKIVFSEQEGREAIPSLIEEALTHIEKNTEHYALAEQNKIEVYRQPEPFADRVPTIVPLFYIKEIDPFYIEDYLFPVEIQEKMKLYALSLMKG